MDKAQVHLIHRASCHTCCTFDVLLSCFAVCSLVLVQQAAYLGKVIRYVSFCFVSMGCKQQPVHISLDIFPFVEQTGWMSFHPAVAVVDMQSNGLVAGV